MSGSERRRLEALWAGDFGDAYTNRNAAAGEGRQPFWTQILERTVATSVLEVGCNLGGNLRWLAPRVDRAAGVDVNPHALSTLRSRLPNVCAVRAAGAALPWEDASFDLTLTVGVLIHQPAESLPGVMREVARCSRRWLLCAEYYAGEDVEVPYRGQAGALFKRDFGALYQAEIPGLRLVERGELGRDEGWDDVTWWLFERAPA